MHKAQKYCPDLRWCQFLHGKESVHPHYKFQKVVKGFGKWKFSFTAVLRQIKSNNQMKPIMVHEIGSTQDQICQRDQRQSIRGSQRSQMRQRQQNCKRHVAKIRASSISICLTPGQMQITDELLQCELICTYRDLTYSQIILSLSFTHTRIYTVRTRAFLSLFNYMPILPSATQSSQASLLCHPDYYW